MDPQVQEKELREVERCIEALQEVEPLKRMEHDLQLMLTWQHVRPSMLRHHTQISSPGLGSSTSFAASYLHCLLLLHRSLTHQLPMWQ